VTQQKPEFKYAAQVLGVIREGIDKVETVEDFWQLVAELLKESPTILDTIMEITREEYRQRVADIFLAFREMIKRIAR
jgi:hypothetical protein